MKKITYTKSVKILKLSNITNLHKIVFSLDYVVLKIVELSECPRKYIVGDLRFTK